MKQARSTQNRTRSRRVQAWACLTCFLTGQLGPLTVAGAPALIARPGMGISSLPLEALAFDAPGFGSFRDAVNLVSGNVFVSVDGFGSNNLRTGADDPSITMGGSGWNYAALRWINGFYPYQNLRSSVRGPCRACSTGSRGSWSSRVRTTVPSRTFTPLMARAPRMAKMVNTRITRRTCLSSTRARRMRFEYRQIGRWWYVTGITHTAPDVLH
jgi:hypothetical protein